jgi:hypothetical protein
LGYRPGGPDYPFRRGALQRNRQATAVSEGGCRVVRGPFRSVHRSGRCVARELLDGTGDPAPGRGAVAVSVSGELIGTRAAFLERFMAVALEH